MFKLTNFISRVAITGTGGRLAMLEKGLEYFQQAIATDPGYAPAYAGLADSYILLANLGVLESSVAVPDAKAAARRALELDNELAEAHASLGIASLYDHLGLAGCREGTKTRH